MYDVALLVDCGTFGPTRYSPWSSGRAPTRDIFPHRRRRSVVPRP